YLRWFEEWAEDFCRKKKKKLENLDTQCRGKDNSSHDRYCSRNGYDCEKTKRAIGKLRYGKQCISCLYGCNPYVDWIDKKKEEFDKQVKKYTDEIKIYTEGAPVSRRQKRGAGGISTKVYDGYEKKFYDELKKNNYGTVDKFLEKLSNEEICKKITTQEEGRINFEKVNTGGTAGSGGTSGASGTNDKNEGTFYRSKYCQPCPICGVKKKRNGDSGNQWEEKNDDNCKNIKLYEPKPGVVGTPIEILKSGEGHDDIKEKIEQFCKTQNGTGSGSSGGGNSEKKELYDEWKCYQFEQLRKVGQDDDDDDYDKDVEHGGGLCILKNTNKKNLEDPEQFQKTFNNFFYYWVAHMLKDSIYWRTKKLEKCLKNGTKIICKKGCHGKCDCFEKWVVQKKTEWKNIKIHFGKQDFGNQEGFLGEGMKSPDFVLKYVLKLDELFQNIKEAYGNVKELKGIEELLDEEKKREEEDEAAGVTDNENKTTIDKLLQHEEKDAKTCLDTHNEENCKQQQEDKGGARILTTARNGPTDEPDDDEYEEDDEDDDEDDDEKGNLQEEEEEIEEDKDQVEEETAKETTEDTQVDGDKGEKGPKVEDICDIVKTALKVDNLTQACSLKYGPKAPTSWKCIPSGDKTDTSDGEKATTGSEPTSGKDRATGGSICVPPRRRRLYVTPLTKWANETLSSGETQPPQGQTPSQSGEKLREAFIQSAAIETFFLWHKYKMDKKKEDEEKKEARGIVPGTPVLPVEDEDDENKNKDPQTELNDGNIPEEFKRQMFYTLGDYRDIFFGKDIGGGDNIEKVKENINKVFPNRTSDGKQSGDNQRSEWWQQHGKDIWQGMLCALSYNTETKIKDEELRKKLIEHNKNSNKYDNVAFKGGFNENSTKLVDFVKRPPYFRWLEEWAEEFCRKQKHKLYIIEKDCRGNDGDKNCSGDGFDCNELVPKKEDIFKYFDCSTCAKSCRFYRKWIKQKGKEYEKQKEEYSKQKEKCEKESNNHDNGFCGRLKTTSSTAAEFLENIKGEPCKNNENGEYIIDFSQPNKTFKHATNCDPCSEFKIKCQNDNCTAGTQNECNGKTAITAKKIKQMRKSTDGVSMLVSDDSTNGVEGDDLKACIEAGIFKGFRKDVWECGNVCGVDICTLKKDKNGEEGDEKPIIMKELLKRWLETFFEDYNKIKKKVKACTKSGKGSTCIRSCVDKWIEKKTEEWKKINDKYLDQNTKVNPDGNNLKTFLEDGPFKNEVDKAIKPCDDLNAFESFCGLNGDEKSKTKDGYQDAIDCMLNKLQQKAKNCADQASGEEKHCGEYNPPDEEEDLLLEEDENENPLGKEKVGKQAPGFCEIEEPKETVDDRGCEPAKTTPKEPSSPAPSERQTPKAPVEPLPPALPPAPPPPTKPANPPSQPTPPYLSHPAVIPSL
ncbi:hypothetical protein PFMC_05966, partial [Plasmodium falciparum CAMP/Malaysia]